LFFQLILLSSYPTESLIIQKIPTKAKITPPDIIIAIIKTGITQKIVKTISGTITSFAILEDFFDEIKKVMK